MTVNDYLWQHYISPLAAYGFPASFRSTKRSGNTSFDANTGEVSLHGNVIAKLDLEPYTGWMLHGNLEWINLCGYPTRTTVNRLRQLTNLPLRRKSGSVVLTLLGREFTLPNSGEFPIRRICNTLIRGKYPDLTIGYLNTSGVSFRKANASNWINTSLRNMIGNNDEDEGIEEEEEVVDLERLIEEAEYNEDR